MRLYFTTLLMLLAGAPSFSQETKTVTEKSGGRGSSKVKIVYSVLKDNKNVKHGPYQYYLNDKLRFSWYYKMDKKDSTWITYTHTGKVLTKRSYAENVKTGIWEFYDMEGTPLWRYDFATHTHNRPQIDSLMYFSYQAADGSWVHGKLDVNPFWLCSKFEWAAFLNRTLQYPQEAIDKELMGAVLVDITIDETGQAIDYAVAAGQHQLLNEEALRVMRLYEFDFIPAENNGKKVKTKIRLPIVFRFEKG